MSCHMYKHGSIVDGLKSQSTSDFLSFLYQLKLPCFCPYIFNLILGRIADKNLIMFDHELGIQFEVASKYFLPGLLAKTPIQSLLLFNQGCIFGLLIE